MTKNRLQHKNTKQADTFMTTVCTNNLVSHENAIFVVENFLSTEECESLIAQGERVGYEANELPTEVGLDADELDFMRAVHFRTSSKALSDDEMLAKKLWDRAKEFLPADATLLRNITNYEGYHSHCFNERFRFYKQDDKQYHKPHCDSPYKRQVLDAESKVDERSILTCLITLNNVEEGGADTFWTLDESRTVVSIPPKRGCAIFYMQNLLHESEPVIGGSKHYLRTDVMFRKTSSDLDLSDIQDFLESDNNDDTCSIM
jgi:hypothetical protein